MAKAPMSKLQKSVPTKSSGSHLTPRPDGVRMKASGSKEKPDAKWIAPKSTPNDKERPVMKTLVRKQPPVRKAGSAKFTPKSAK